RILKHLPRGPRLDAIRDFVHDARLALALTNGAIKSTAQPIQLETAQGQGRTWELSAQVQAYALALTITFLGLLLAAGALAAERDGNAIGRLARGRLALGRQEWRRIALAGVVRLVRGLVVPGACRPSVGVGRVLGGGPG